MSYARDQTVTRVFQRHPCFQAGERADLTGVEEEAAAKDGDGGGHQWAEVASRQILRYVDERAEHRHLAGQQLVTEDDGAYRSRSVERRAPHHAVDGVDEQ